MSYLKTKQVFISKYCPSFSTIQQRPISRYKVKSYQDHVEYDNNNKYFYIYYLGRYHNKPIYTYGETLDIDSVEFHLNKTYPFYKKHYVSNVGDKVYSKDKLDKVLKAQTLYKKWEEIEVFTTSDVFGISEIDALINDLFCEPTTHNSLS